MPSKSAQRYAQALYDFAKEETVLGPLRQDIQALTELMHQSPELKFFVQNPIIPVTKRRAVVENLFKDRLHPLTYRFLFFLINKGKLRYLSEIFERFNELHEEARGRLKVRLLSAVELKADQIKKIADKLQNHFGKVISAETQIDPDLLGGFKVQIRDQIYDFTIKEQLRRFEESVMGS